MTLYPLNLEGQNPHLEGVNQNLEGGWRVANHQVRCPPVKGYSRIFPNLEG
jgi:hypothetical protein